MTETMIQPEDLAEAVAEVTGLEVFEAGAYDPTGMAEAFRRNGALQLRGLLDADEVDAIRTAFTDFMAAGPAGRHDDGVPDGDPLKAWPRMIQPHREDTAPGRLALPARRAGGRTGP